MCQRELHGHTGQQAFPASPGVRPHCQWGRLSRPAHKAAELPLHSCQLWCQPRETHTGKSDVRWSHSELAHAFLESKPFKLYWPVKWEGNRLMMSTTKTWRTFVLIKASGILGSEVFGKSVCMAKFMWRILGRNCTAGDWGRLSGSEFTECPVVSMREHFIVTREVGCLLWPPEIILCCPECLWAEGAKEMINTSQSKVSGIKRHTTPCVAFSLPSSISLGGYPCCPSVATMNPCIV